MDCHGIQTQASPEWRWQTASAMALSIPQCVQQNFPVRCQRRCAPRLCQMGGTVGGVGSFRLSSYNSVFPSRSLWPIILTKPIVSLAKVITANIPVSRLAVNVGSRMEGEAKTWLGSTQGTVFCVLCTVQLRLWVVRQQRKPSTLNCDFCYCVNGGNSHRHK
jgi:hypothetical protein